MLRWASLCISRYANEVKTFCGSVIRWLFVPSLCVTGSLLSSAFIPYKALPEASWTQHEISGLRHSHSLPESDLESSRQRWERRLLIGQKRFEWTQCSRRACRSNKEQIRHLPCFNLCPLAEREGCMWCCLRRFNSRGCLDWGDRDGENQGADCHLSKRGRSVCHWRRMPYLCAVTHSGEHIQCWVVQLEFVGADTVLKRNLYDRVCVCVGRPWTCVNIWGWFCCLLVLTHTTSTACRLYRRPVLTHIVWNWLKK